VRKTFRGPARSTGNPKEDLHDAAPRRRPEFASLLDNCMHRMDLRLA
jgi:hypothetical protein